MEGRRMQRKKGSWSWVEVRASSEILKEKLFTGCRMEVGCRIWEAAAAEGAGEARRLCQDEFRGPRQALGYLKALVSCSGGRGEQR